MTAPCTAKAKKSVMVISFASLSQTYEAEQKQLEAEAITLQQEIEVQERQNENIEKFIQKAHKYVGIEELDGYTLRELVSAIYVDAPDKSSGKRKQKVKIFFNFVDDVDIPVISEPIVTQTTYERRKTA